MNKVILQERDFNVMQERNIVDQQKNRIFNFCTYLIDLIFT